jgi:hypothetical protein
MSKRLVPQKTGRPKKEPPPGAADKVKELASEGHSTVGIAERFNVSVDTFNRWTDEDPELKFALDKGREKERYTLHNSLYMAATEGGNASAAMFLLKSRHGYREGDQSEQGNRVSITFALPGAMPLNDFKVIQNDSPDNSTKQLPAATSRPTRRA